MKNLQIDEITAHKLYDIASTEFRQILEDIFGIEFFIHYPKLDKPVEVAGIMWGGYLNPSVNCNAPVKFNKKIGLFYFNNKTSAILHAFEQDLKLPTKHHFQQLYNQTTQRNEIVGNIKYKVFTDKETGKELWMMYSGYYNFESKEFRCVEDYGLCWSESVYNATVSYNLRFSSGYVSPQDNNLRRLGFPVRCVIS